MDVLVSLGEVPLLKRSRFLGTFIKPLLDALVVVNRLYLRAHHVPPLYESGVRYMQEPPDGKPEEFAAIPVVLSRGWGDAMISRRIAWRNFKRQARRQRFELRGGASGSAGRITCW